MCKPNMDYFDYLCMHRSMVIATVEKTTVAKHLRNSIECRLEDVKNEDGTICPPEDRVGWKELVY